MCNVLNIAVDCRPLLFPNCGFGRYLSGLLREFAKAESSHHFHLYCERPFELDFRLPDHWRIRTGSFNFRGSGTLSWQLLFPLWARRDHIDVYWSPRHHLPFFLPRRCRKVVTVHDVGWKRFPKRMERLVYLFETLFVPFSIRTADQIITISQFSKSEILTFFPHANRKTNVVYRSSSLRSDGDLAPCPLSRPYFLAVGFEPRKNVERMLKSYLLYRHESRQPWDLVIAGAGHWGAFDVRNFVAENGLQSCVHLARGIDDSTFRSFYAHAGALVMVSLYEGFGLPLIEAMQWGLPIIASQTTSVAEVAGAAGIAVDPSSMSAIASALLRMEEDEELLVALKQKSLERGRQFNCHREATETLALLQGDSLPDAADCDIARGMMQQPTARNQTL